jgi:hypothetical protein
MKAGTITAKIRDAVWVRFMEGETEKIRYRNIEMPLSLKDLEITDFTFDVPTDASGKITFKLYFAEGILPEEFPAPRPRVTRAEKAAAKAAETISSKEGTSRNATHPEDEADNTKDTSEIHTLAPEMAEGIIQNNTLSPEADTADDMSETHTITPEKPKAKRGGKRKTA